MSTATAIAPVEKSEPAAAHKPKLLVIDDEVSLGQSLSRVFTRRGYDVIVESEPLEGVLSAQQHHPDVVLLDLRLPNVSGVDVLKDLKARSPDLQVVMMTGDADVSSALASIRNGAYDYLLKPFDDVNGVVNVVRKAYEHKQVIDRNRQLEQLVSGRAPEVGFIGDSPRMREIAALVQRVGPSKSTVLVQGESGTGKELVARAIHAASERRSKPFIAVNCAAMTETLLESELFGHLKGAFTGAQQAKRGLFEAATGGTLFLDEIGDMPMSTQVHLLRALQVGEVRPVGSTETIKVDVRVVAATNVDLRAAIAAGKFREDLFYRLNVINLVVPPLRERPSDIPPLAYHFLRASAARAGKRCDRIDSRALTALVSCRWPGNVRELENTIERAVVLAQGTEVTIDDLPPHVQNALGGAESDAMTLSGMPYVQAKRLALGAFNRSYLKGLLAKSNGNVTAAANMAGLDRSNFRRLLKQFSVQPKRPGQPEAVEAEPEQVAGNDDGDGLGDDDALDVA
ncbi:MAG: sigma-54-dependent Fis family transcriptional regulator [Myxococcaceae bacterium]|nr:sigma-54-dependent Fis family transcriptional regulator [Myxococcaceae bacterium]